MHHTYMSPNQVYIAYAAGRVTSAQLMSWLAWYYS